jgi:hypothetical protein
MERWLFRMRSLFLPGVWYSASASRHGDCYMAGTIGLFNKEIFMKAHPALANFAAFTLISAAPITVLAQTQAASTTQVNDLPAVDKAFVQAASESSSTEIDTAELASKQRTTRT